MSADPLCLTCGHPRDEHYPERLDGWGPSKGRYLGYHGRCTHDDVRPYGLDGSCSCTLYAHDHLPRVTELLGSDVRRVVESAVFRARPAFDYEEGDLVEVMYGGTTRTHRVRRVLPDVHDQRVYDLDPLP